MLRRYQTHYNYLCVPKYLRIVPHFVSKKGNHVIILRATIIIIIIIIVIIIIIIMFLNGYPCFLFLDPQDVVGPSISSSVALRSFVFCFILQCLFW